MPREDTLLVLRDFNASTGTDSDGYETCVGPHESGTVNQNSTKFLDFARSHGFRVAGSWFQCPQPQRCTWYSNAGGVANKIDHVLVDGRWKMIQNCRVYGVPSSSILQGLQNCEVPSSSILTTGLLWHL